MQLVRSYYNSGEELLRIDEIDFQLSYPTKEIVTYTFGDMTVIPREERKTTLVQTVSYLAREVATITLSGDYGESDNSGDFLWATWTLGNGQIVTSDMSNLPGVGDTVTVIQGSTVTVDVSTTIGTGAGTESP